ncbi:MAG: DUF2075 domain-containing protein [Rhizobiaceae bacterium]|nr:DUF2075 domain-containing protein [Rhizobiaceae bacterium]
MFVIEYKVGSTEYDQHAKDQVTDYALDLKNFHEGSHERWLVPIVVATKAVPSNTGLIWQADRVAEPLCSNGDNLSDIIDLALQDRKQGQSPAANGSDGSDWARTGYKPTPTIVEAAQALYEGHNVEDISRSGADAKNLSITSECIFEIIAHSRQNRRKSICFVTGVPGAGKTLAGLNISTRTLNVGNDEHAVFLSGNGPLVLVLREALARDEVNRSKAAGTKIKKKAALQSVSAFIQNIHHFRDEYLRTSEPPVDHVVVFDEAQRAWNRQSAEKFMVQKRGEPSFEMSEPEFLISVMDRRQDWATIVCLIGGGQEINTGEAGLVEWFDALQRKFPHWDVYHSGQLSNPTYSWGEDLSAKLGELNSVERPDLHLSVSVRSFRAEQLSNFVGCVIDGDELAAKQIFEHLAHYPLAVTRNYATARNWIRRHARGSERTGVVASSGALRLRPEGIHIKAGIDPAAWFLNGKDDVRSSYYLEEVATEFDVQGLELDWTIVCWDANFRRLADGWGYFDFVGTKWQNVSDRFRKVYLANAYRVLLTRARQGMIIFMPEGQETDQTRPPHFYDQTFEFLKACGVPVVE